jgi:proteasome accessory factor A
MIASSTKRKVGLVKLALKLCEEGSAPIWQIKDPVGAFKAISRDESYKFIVELERRSWTSATEVFESYFSAAESTLELDADDRWTIESSRQLLAALTEDWLGFARKVDWAAKRVMLEHFIEEEGSSWRDPALQSFDLEYSNLDPDEGLHYALAEMGTVEPNPRVDWDLSSQGDVCERTRAWARAIAIRRFAPLLTNVCWRSMTFQTTSGRVEVELRPDATYPAELETANDVESFIEMLRGVV